MPSQAHVLILWLDGSAPPTASAEEVTTRRGKAQCPRLASQGSPRSERGTRQRKGMAELQGINRHGPVIIGCCPGLYRVLKNAISPSKASYPYDSYDLRGHGGSGIPSNRSGAFGRTDIHLTSFRAKQESYRSASAYRSTSPSSSQGKLADPSDMRNITVNYGVAVTVEDWPSDYGQAARFV